MTKKKSEPKTEAAALERVIAYKGFAADLSCTPPGVKFQYAIGETYKHEGKIVRCGADGFHSCEYPLDVFRFYAPAGNRFCEVEATGEIARAGSDSKIASAEITIKAELHLSELTQRAVKWVFDRATPEGEMATGDQGAASATGYQGAASATGYHACAAAFGYEGSALADETGAIFLVYRDYSTGEIKHTFASKVGKNGIEPNKRYRLSPKGRPVEIAS